MLIIEKQKKLLRIKMKELNHKVGFDKLLSDRMRTKQ